MKHEMRLVLLHSMLQSFLQDLGNYLYGHAPDKEQLKSNINMLMEYLDRIQEGFD